MAFSHPVLLMQPFPSSSDTRRVPTTCFYSVLTWGLKSNQYWAGFLTNHSKTSEKHAQCYFFCVRTLYLCISERLCSRTCARLVVEFVSRGGGVCWRVQGAKWGGVRDSEIGNARMSTRQVG